VALVLSLLASLPLCILSFTRDLGDVRTLTVYSNKFTLVRINKLLIAYHLNTSIYTN
jgi:hypothetical protein